MNDKCNKVDARIECLTHGYPYCEAMYSDNQDTPLPCDADDETIDNHIVEEIIRTKECFERAVREGRC